MGGIDAMKITTQLNAKLTRLAQGWEAVMRRAFLHFGTFIHISCITMVRSTQGASTAPVGERETEYAKRTAGAEAPSGRYRQCSTYRQNSDRRDTRDDIAATSQAQQRFGGGKGACGEHNARGPQSDCPKGRSGSVGLMEIKSPRRAFVKAAADELTSNYSAPSIPVLEIAENNGVDVVFADFGTLSDKVAGFCDFAAAKLFVNDADQVNRQLFTIAHEFGHWMLHRPIFKADPKRYPVLPRFHTPDRNDPLEVEANHFAANILVPERLLKPIKNAPVSALAKSFGVSVTMMEFRLKNVR